MGQRKKSYTAAPEVPAEQSERLAMILEVLAGHRTVSEAARALGMSRNHFQTILHRALGSLVESITPQAGGRPARPKEVTELEAETERLRRENSHLKDQVSSTDQLLQAASGLLQGRIRPVRQARARKTKGGGDEDKGEGDPRQLREIARMRERAVPAAFVARMAGVHESTVRRWNARQRLGQDAARRSRAAILSAHAVGRAADLVRELRGQVGAASLSRSVAGLSRRQAACVKAETLTQMERDRKAALTRVCVSVPGVVRGIDGIYLRAAGARVHALIAADAAVPYRTFVRAGARYDAKLVATTLASDIESNGAPLVYRLDRAMAHDGAEVRELLDAHDILLLHGPPHCPRFYGQLERQNREHRAWAAELEQLPIDEIEPRLLSMLRAVNGLWRRRTLGWKTAHEAWTERPELVVDRAQLRQEVIERAAWIGRQLQRRGKPADLAQRLAIEQALQNRGYLRQTIGGWC